MVDVWTPFDIASAVHFSCDPTHLPRARFVCSHVLEDLSRCDNDTLHLSQIDFRVQYMKPTSPAECHLSRITCKECHLLPCSPTFQRVCQSCYDQILLMNRHTCTIPFGLEIREARVDQMSCGRSLVHHASMWPTDIPIRILGAETNEGRQSFVVVTSQRSVLEVSFVNGEIIELVSAGSVPVVPAKQHRSVRKQRERVLIQCSKIGNYVAVGSVAALEGIVVDCDARCIVYRFSREAYHEDRCDFPFCWIEDNLQDDPRSLLVHASSWNLLRVVSVATGDLVVREPEEGPEFFFGELVVSPGSKWIASSGWVWHPIGFLFRIGTEGLMRSGGNVEYESVGGKTFHESDDWGFPLAFCDDRRLVVGGMQDCSGGRIEGIPYVANVLLIFDVQSTTVVGRIHSCIGFPGFCRSIAVLSSPLECEEGKIRLAALGRDYECWNVGKNVREMICGIPADPQVSVVAQGGLAGSKMLFLNGCSEEGDELWVSTVASTIFRVLGEVLVGAGTPFADTIVCCTT